MAISTYGELKTAMENWPSRSDAVYTARIPEFIALGEAMLFTDLRVREIEATGTITTTGAQREDPLPTRFVQARDLYITGTPNVRLEYRSPAEYWSVYSSLTSAKPIYYAIVGENIVWAPVPDAAYTVKVDHYARPAVFTADADTNAVIARWPNLYLYASLVHAQPFIKDDPRILTMATLYQEQIAQVHDADRRDRASGDPMPGSRSEGLT